MANHTLNITNRLKKCNQDWELYQSKTWLPRSSKIDLALTMYLLALQGGTVCELGPFVGGTSVYLSRISQASGDTAIFVDSFQQSTVCKLDGKTLLEKNLRMFDCENFSIIQQDIDLMCCLPPASFYFLDVWSADLDHLSALIDDTSESTIYAIDDIFFYGKSVDSGPTKNRWPEILQQKIDAKLLYPLAVSDMRGFFSRRPRPDLIKAIEIFCSKNHWVCAPVDYCGHFALKIDTDQANPTHCAQCQSELGERVSVKFI